MKATITPSRVTGSARAPPSKSYTHRAILASGYAANATVTDGLWSADTRATARAVELFGGAINRNGDTGALSITGFDGRPSVPSDVIDCANSGTTTRLVTATASLADGITVITGDESLRSRPQGPLLEAIDALGGSAESTRGNGQAPLVIRGPITGGSVSIPGDVSSQYITALLMAGAVTDEGIDIDLETQLKSAPYVDVTIDVLDAFGVSARETPSGFAVDGGQTYEPDGGEYAVPGDFSSISYLLAAGAIAGGDADDVAEADGEHLHDDGTTPDDSGPHNTRAKSEHDVRIQGAHPSAQGDRAILDVVNDMGGTVEWDRDAGTIGVSRSSLSGITVSVEDTPDLLPTIAVLGAVASGETHIVDAEHVRYKETDRVSAMAEELETMNASVTETDDALIIHGDESSLTGGVVDGRGDHRIVMALTLAGLVATGETTIDGSEHVDVSFPGFFETLSSLGATVRAE